MAFFLDFKILKNSIVNTLENSGVKNDSSEPYELIEFVRNLDISNIGNDFVVDAYNKYLVEWTKIQNSSTESFEEVRKAKYIQLLKNIQINYITQDEERILGNIDYDNPLELEIAIPFFVEKIKDIIEYYIKRRRDVKNSKAKWSTKGSKRFLEKTIAEYIIDNYTQDVNTFQRYKQDYQELSSFQNNYRLEYDGLYDLNDYRSVEFIVEPESFERSPSDFEISSLPITSFSDYFNSETTTIEELKKLIYKKYISTDKTYYGDSVIPVESTTTYFDPYNYDTPFISRISDTSNLLRDKDIGYFFTSKYIYTSNYFSPYGISLTATEAISGITPKIDVYRSEEYKDYFFWSKYGKIFGGLSGRPVGNSRLKRFFGYQNRDINLSDSVGGVEKYTDGIQIWSGKKNSVWSNEDVFSKYKDNVLNRTQKNEFFFTLNDNESVYKYVCDIFGNSYYLIKEINTSSSKSELVYRAINSTLGNSSDLFNIYILGQRVSALDSLRGIQIQPDTALGFYINSTSLSSSFVTEFKDLNIEENSYFLLDTGIYDSSTTGVLTSDTKKSIYENQYTVGRLVVRDANNRYVDNIGFFLGNSDGIIYNEVVNNLINVDIINDFVIFTTRNRIITGKIDYDYTESKIIFRDLSKDENLFRNRVLEKTASYWYETKTERVYFADVNHTTDSISIYYVETESNTKTIYDIDDSDISYETNMLLTKKYISKPQLVKRDNFIYLIILISDSCENYYYQAIKYSVVSKNKLKAVYNRIYHPSNLKINSNVKTDSAAISSQELSSYDSTIFRNSAVEVYTPDTSAKNTYNLTYSPYETSQYYDNDRGGVISKSKPSKTYLLSNLISNASVESNITETDVLYTFTGEYVYTPVDIILDFRNILNFSSIVSRTEPIYKIEFFVNGFIRTQYILENSQIDFDNNYRDTGVFPLSALGQNLASSPLSAVAVDNTYSSAIALNQADGQENTGIYNNEFQNSPINMKYISFKNYQTNFSIVFYSLNGKKYTLDFNFQPQNFFLSEQYSKVELLDVRIRETNTDQLDCLLYLNTRAPDSILNTSLLNI